MHKKTQSKCPEFFCSSVYDLIKFDLRKTIFTPVFGVNINFVVFTWNKDLTIGRRNELDVTFLDRRETIIVVFH